MHGFASAVAIGERWPDEFVPGISVRVLGLCNGSVAVTRRGTGGGLDGVVSAQCRRSGKGAIASDYAAAVAQRGALSREGRWCLRAPSLGDAVAALEHGALDEAAHALGGRGRALTLWRHAPLSR
jgi:hypothetical protein